MLLAGIIAYEIVRENGTTVGAATSGNGSSSSSDNSSDLRDLTLKQIGVLQRHTEAVACLLAVQDDDVEVGNFNTLHYELQVVTLDPDAQHNACCSTECFAATPYTGMKPSSYCHERHYIMAAIGTDSAHLHCV
jgi:hypothetical protein